MTELTCSDASRGSKLLEVTEKRGKSTKLLVVLRNQMHLINEGWRAVVKEDERWKVAGWQCSSVGGA